MTGAKRRIGQARNGRSFLLTDHVTPNREGGRIKPVYMTFEYLELVKPLGCENDAAGLELRANDEAIAQVRETLPNDRPRIGIAPGAEWETKRWTAEGYAAVADGLAERIGAVCALLTGPKEKAIHDAICSAAKSTILRCDDGRPTVDTLKATISELDLLVCNDSGARHVAIAFDVPTVCIMGPTSPDYSTGPYERGEILQEPVDCGPCQKPTCATGDHRCMTAITPDRVVDAILNHLPARR
jgi:heptosyltransferase-2